MEKSRQRSQFEILFDSLIVPSPPVRSTLGLRAGAERKWKLPFPFFQISIENLVDCLPNSVFLYLFFCQNCVSIVILSVGDVYQFPVIVG